MSVFCYDISVIKDNYFYIFNLVYNYNFNKLHILDALIITCYYHLGDGKTHYIKNQFNQSSVVLAINESFSICRILTILNSLDDTNECTIHFNFTLLPPGVCLINMDTYTFHCIAFISEQCNRWRKKTVHSTDG